MRFPMPPSLDGIPIPDKLRQVLQRWMSDLRLWAAGLSSGGTIATQDEGVSVDPAAATLNFVGAGVTATDAGGHVTTVTIPGGSGVTSITATAPIVATPSPIVGVGVVSHAVSGVTAATYGDATHYPVLTVDANGHLTAASNQVVSAAATITTQDEGVTLSTTVTTENFVGTGVTASGAGATTTITIPGAGQAGGQFNWGLYIAGKGCPI